MSNGTPVTYKVTAVNPDTQVTPQNTVVTGKRVSFTTSTGYEGSVFVPAGVFGDRAAVQRLIAGEVEQVVAAMAIAGTVAGS